MIIRFERLRDSYALALISKVAIESLGHGGHAAKPGIINLDFLISVLARDPLANSAFVVEIVSPNANRRDELDGTEGKTSTGKLQSLFCNYWNPFRFFVLRV